MGKRQVSCVGCDLLGYFGPSRASVAVKEPGAVAAAAEYRKSLKYKHISPSYHFIPISVETLGVFGNQARGFFRELAQRIKKETDDELALQRLTQRTSVAIKRGSVVSVLGCLG